MNRRSGMYPNSKTTNAKSASTSIKSLRSYSIYVYVFYMYMYNYIYKPM